jgi:hypothetical protein
MQWTTFKARWPNLSAIETQKLTYRPWQKQETYLRKRNIGRGHVYSGRGIGASLCGGPSRANGKGETQNRCFCPLQICEQISNFWKCEGQVRH